MRWAVAVEENRADGWRLSYLRRFARSTAARADARRMAHEHRPEQPSAPRGRTVLRREDDTFLVQVEGRSQDFCFRVQVWEIDPVP